jgi:hypothetical protein
VGKEAEMDKPPRSIIICCASALGAAAAAALAYLFTSERGRAWLERLPEATRDLTREGQRLLGAVQHVVEQVVDATHPATGE